MDVENILHTKTPINVQQMDVVIKAKNIRHYAVHVLCVDAQFGNLFMPSQNRTFN